jgi:signal transduction histidine kinase
MVATARDQVRDALAELRRTVATLRAPVEADLALEPALKRLAGGFEQATGISVHLSLPEVLPSLSAPQRLALYRGAQEGLTNIQKHAQASQAWLSLEQQNGQLSLVVSDDGMGLEDGATGQDGFGLRGLQERAAQLGGQVYLEPRTGGGTQLSMMVPLVTGGEDLA